MRLCVHMFIINAFSIQRLRVCKWIFIAYGLCMRFPRNVINAHDCIQNIVKYLQCSNVLIIIDAIFVLLRYLSLASSGYQNNLISTQEHYRTKCLDLIPGSQRYIEVSISDIWYQHIHFLLSITLSIFFKRFLNEKKI